jgi:integrase
MSDVREFNFIKSKLDGLPPAAPGKRDTYRDTKVPGLIIRVTEKGVKTFAVYRRIKGEAAPVKVTVGPYPDVSIEQARRRAEEHIGTMALGANPNDKREAKKADLTFGELFKKYLEEHARKHKKSHDEDEAQYERHLKKRWGEKKLSAITKADVRELHAKLGQKVKLPKPDKKQPSEVSRRGKVRPESGGIYAANRVLALIRTVYNWGIKNEVITCDNPARGITMFKEKSRERRLHGHELPEFFEALALEPNDTIRDYVLMSLMTGARRSNVLAMRWDEISYERAIWAIPETKNGTSQDVPLTKTALELLKKRQAGNKSPYVFPGQRGQGHLVEPKAGWKRILERAGVSNLRIHDLRRTLGSMMVDQGATLVIVGKALNHKSHAATQVYSRLDTEPVRAYMEKSTEAMMAAATKKKPGTTTGRVPASSGGAWVE